MYLLYLILLCFTMVRPGQTSMNTSTPHTPKITLGSQRYFLLIGQKGHWSAKPLMLTY